MADSVTNEAQPENPDKVALFRGILSHPTDILRRRVFADWLDDFESSNPDSVKRAEYLRGCAESGVGSVVSLCMGALYYPNWRVFGLYSPGGFVNGQAVFPGERFDRAEDMTKKSAEVLPYLHEFTRVLSLAAGEMDHRMSNTDVEYGFSTNSTAIMEGIPGELFVEIKYGYPQRIWCRTSLWMGVPCHFCNIAIRDSMGFFPETGCSHCNGTGRRGALGPALRKRFPIAQVNLLDWFYPTYSGGALRNVLRFDEGRTIFFDTAAVMFPKVFMEIVGYEEVFGIDTDIFIPERNPARRRSELIDPQIHMHVGRPNATRLAQQDRDWITRGEIPISEGRITSTVMNATGANEPTLKVPHTLWPYLRRAKYAHRISENNLRRRFVHYPDAEVAYDDWTEALSLWAADVAGILDQETGGVIDHDHSRNYGDAERDDGSPD